MNHCFTLERFSKRSYLFVVFYRFIKFQVKKGKVVWNEKLRNTNSQKKRKKTQKAKAFMWGRKTSQNNKEEGVFESMLSFWLVLEKKKKWIPFFFFSHPKVTTLKTLPFVLKCLGFSSLALSFFYPKKNSVFSFCFFSCGFACPFPTPPHIFLFLAREKEKRRRWKAENPKKFPSQKSSSKSDLFVKQKENGTKKSFLR